MKTPCKNCLLVPICKYKGYRMLVEGCDIITNFLYKQPKVMHDIKPSKWNAKYRRSTFGIRANYVSDDLNSMWYYSHSSGIVRHVE